MRAILSNEPVIPIRVGLRNVALRPQSDDGNRHLKSNQRIVVNEPIELVHITQMEGWLVDRLALNDGMPILQREPRELAWRHTQDRRGRINALAEQGSHILGDRAIAGCGDNSFSARKLTDDTAQASVRQNEIGIEKNLPMFSHLLTKIAESPM